jgi:hypothetical protein
VTVYQLPEGEGYYSGHVVIEWHQKRLAFQVTMHGHRNVERAELMSQALMREVARCPSGERRGAKDQCRLVF